MKKPDQQRDEVGREKEAPLPVLLERLSPAARQALAVGLGEALRIGQFWLGVEFLLMGLSKQDGGLFAELLAGYEIDRRDLRGALRGLVKVKAGDWRSQPDVEALGAAALPNLKEADPATLAQLYAADKQLRAVITPRAMAILRDAAQLARERSIEPEHLLEAALQYPDCVAVNLLLSLVGQSGHDPLEFIRVVQELVKHDGNDEPGPAGVPPAPAMLQRVPPTARVRPVVGGVLAKLGRDLTQLALNNQLRPAVGDTARKTMAQIGLILQQTQANNPILLGEPGVGKTAIVEGFAWRLANDPKVLEKLAGCRVIDLSAGALLSGTKYRGELESRLKKLLDEVRQADGQIIVFIDEIHTILGGKAEGGLGSMADMLKPALARGEFPCIGATTVAEYRRYIEADPALARRFTPVWIDEPSPDEAVAIVQEVADQHLGPSHHVKYSPEVVREAVQLSVHYVHDEFLPGKAIKLLDQAGPRVTMGTSLSGRPEPAPATGDTVTVDIVRAIVAERTGIPLTRLSRDERGRLLNLENQLRERVKGQDEAIQQVARVVKRARAGLADPRRPPGVFLFTGPTGVGKTELALALAEAVFDEEDAIFRLDMSEYLEKHQVARLIGSPPGYVGYEDEGQLTGRLRRRPYSIVLLDEMEKAHPDVQHLFLQLFDAGRLTDARGNLADGRNAIFIMTTNLGAKEALGFIREPKSYEEKFRVAIEQYFSPEFLNRLDRIIFFNPLTEGLLLEIFDKLFARAAKRFQAQGLGVRVTPALRQALCAECAKDLARGARPLERMIEDSIVVPLTDKLLGGEIRPGMKTTIDIGQRFEIEAAVPPRPGSFGRTPASQKDD